MSTRFTRQAISPISHLTIHSSFIQLSIMTSRLLLTLLPFLLISLSHSAPINLVAECNNHGYISHNKCVCIKGTLGDKCNYLVSMMCVNGECPYPWMDCKWFNEDCRNAPLRCLDKRGWCIPFEHPPSATITHEEALNLTLS
ncbi:hypothetical protein PRIPAC_88534 [Pristionchus pacificus]|uniref:Uncharacterized protein n=1 Tax=Pristionchus pacificus TaxID=54126 RepID=A0A2A6CZ83_PRIPA|nr:hypothetical protein PRIPAC_88534 [Pristionchus pacificus]|eukprot:PDM83367.1 hypothetical protein PRIPAC_34999 [Pristionchus pacificus]